MRLDGTAWHTRHVPGFETPKFVPAMVSTTNRWSVGALLGLTAVTVGPSHVKSASLVDETLFPRVRDTLYVPSYCPTPVMHSIVFGTLYFENAHGTPPMLIATSPALLK
jgi:hypothetical protein